VLEVVAVVGEEIVVAGDQSLGVEENNKSGMLSKMIRLSPDFENH
ncbi:hypothetical protein A2U01_0088820, partial [Trifolium medium]|nr:hypothetical protein [Trifolium medium]